MLAAGARPVGSSDSVGAVGGVSTGVTVSVAELVAWVRPLHWACARNSAALSPSAVVNVKLARVAPDTVAQVAPPSPLRCHCHVIGRALHLGSAVKAAGEPLATVTLAGCWVMLSVTGTVTVNVAGALVTLPAEFATTTVNTAPLSLGTVAGVV